MDWVRKLHREYSAGNVTEAIALTPARTDTDWFAYFEECAVCFVRGRLTFVGSQNAAPFPSAIAYFGSRVAAFYEVFRDFGTIRVTLKSPDELEAA